MRFDVAKKSENKNEVHEAQYGGYPGGGGGYGRGGGGGYGRGGGYGHGGGGGYGHGGGGGYGHGGGGYGHRGGGGGGRRGGYCQYGCCGHGDNGCYRCCSYKGEAMDKVTQAKPHN